MEKILTHKTRLEDLPKEINSWKITPLDKKNLINYLKDYEMGKVTKRTGGNVHANLERIVYLLRIPLLYLKKSTKDYTKKDLEKLLNALLKNRIKTKDHKKNYTNSGKRKILTELSKFLKWKYPSKMAKFSEILDIKISQKDDDTKYLTIQEIDKLYKACSTARQRYMISMLFASGCRAEEFVNIRQEDIILPKGEDTFVKLRIKNQFSKTEGRTISLYYPKVLEACREFIEEREDDGIRPQEELFNATYDGVRKWLRNLGIRTLGKPINFHMFRHSSATWLSSKMNRQQMCVYFGWKFSSPMPDRYIKRAGVEMKLIDDSVKGTNIEKLKNRLALLEQTRKEEKADVELLKKESNKLLQVIKLNMEINKIRASVDKEIIRGEKGKELNLNFINKQQSKMKKFVEELENL